ncbi:MAG: YggS family pyridoxal phosphate-dependent enzyme [Bacteroidota bacterium]
MIRENLERIKHILPDSVKLVAVSKTKPEEDILEAYQTGHRFFGENKVQELAKKAEQLPDDIEWHMIGHLQSNKVKYIAPFVSLIHAVDSFKLLKTIDKEAKKNNRIIPCLLQIHIATEESKFGLSEVECNEMLKSEEYQELKNVAIHGLMGMATYTDDLDQIRKEFSYLASLFARIKSEYFTEKSSFTELSMGMSNDYLIAVEEGSTMVRIGSSIFGERNYT